MQGGATQPNGGTPARGAGELFVPFQVLPVSSPEFGSKLAVRVQALDGLLDVCGQKLSVRLRFGPAGPHAAGKPPPGDEHAVKCRVDFSRRSAGSAGSWVPECGRGDLRVELPPALTSGAGGVALWLKVTKPGLINASVLAVSAPMRVPLPPSAVQLERPKGPKASAPAPIIRLSVGRILSLEAQSAVAQALAQQAVAQLSSSGGAGAGVPPALDALSPARGWRPEAGVAAALQSACRHAGCPVLRLAVDGKQWDCARALMEAKCDPREVAADRRSPLTVALERGTPPDALLAGDACSTQARRVLADFATLLKEALSTSARPVAAAESSRRWESILANIVEHFGPSARGSGPWSCDVIVLALEHCPDRKVRRQLLCSPGLCAALWRASLDLNLPGLARTLVVWIGLLVSGSPATKAGPSAWQTRRQLLDVQLGQGTDECMLALAIKRGVREPQWLQVARVMVHVGASTSGQVDDASVLLFVLERADKGLCGFSELLASFVEKIGEQVDQWEHPTVLLEENTAECPICMETLWTSTPSAFVSESIRIRCGHFFCFDCASQQFMKQQAMNAAEFHCPICRAPAQEVMPLPDIAINPRLWFQFLDGEGQGRIDRNTVIQALEAMLPIDTELLREVLEEHCWAAWDKNGDGRVSEPEFFAEGGLLEWVLRHLRELRVAKERGPTPPLEQPERWFAHWDVAKYGRIGRAEALTALCESARVSSLESRKIGALKSGIQALWDRHAKGDFVSCESFMKNNLAGQLSKLVRKVNSAEAA